MYDTSTDLVLSWVKADPEVFWHMSALANEWLTDSTPEDVMADLESYVRETLDHAATESPYSVAGKVSGSLSREELNSIDYGRILDELLDV